jgi:5-methyltetrahydropteroyltriglutamate--homocysteine methyltransferase
MRRSTDRILVTHVGALPGPLDLWAASGGEPKHVGEEVGKVVAAQRTAGVDFVNEGELTKGGHWTAYINSRIAGYKAANPQGRTWELMQVGADWKEFRRFYEDRAAAGTLFEESNQAPKTSVGEETRLDWDCVEPLRYVGQSAIQASIAALKAALGGSPVQDAFITSTAPLSVEVGRANVYYKSDEAYVAALAEVLREEYEAIAAAGFQVQIDDAWMAALWDRIGIPMGLAAYKKYCMVRIEALNHALRNIPESQVRYHLCWGSWHGPHAHDITMPDIVGLMLAIKAQTYLFEAANARHEHEVEIWKDMKLPEGKILAPGCVSHSTTLIEHPELVSQRIQRFAKLVGRENVIASTDCGLGLRCHPQIVWAKLKSLAEGAERASRVLWGR